MPNAFSSIPQRSPLSGSAEQLVVLLHGWGADGANLIDLADAMADALPGAHFMAPDAPEICESNPYGFQWFSLMDRHPESLAQGVRRAANGLNKWLDKALAEVKVPPEKLALIGFSQGTMLALHASLRRAPRMLGVVGFSGALIGEETLAKDIVSRPPVCLIHGQYDEVVPYAAMARAEQALKAVDVPVEAHTRPFLGHSIDLEGIEIAKKFLKARLK